MGVKHQVNRYLDTRRREMGRAGFSLRIRQETGKRTVTLKQLDKLENGYFASLEIEEELPSRPADEREPDLWKAGGKIGGILFERFADIRIIELGSSVNTR